MLSKLYLLDNLSLYITEKQKVINSYLKVSKIKKESQSKVGPLKNWCSKNEKGKLKQINFKMEREVIKNT